MANKSTGILLNEEGDLLIEIQRDAKGQIVRGLVLGDVTKQNS